MSLEIPETIPERAQIETKDQARNFISELIHDMAKCRAACDVWIPDPTAVTVQNQRRMMWTFLVKQGKVEGALLALLMAGKIDEKFYREMHQRAINSLVPSNVGQG